MELKEKTAYLEKNLSLQLEWVRSADTKIAPIIFVTTSMLGATAAVLSKTPQLGGLTLLLATICVATLGATLYCVIIVTFPRIRSGADSMLFFEDIRKKSAADFEKKTAELTEDDYFRDLVGMCHTNAVIASEKFKFVRRAMLFLFSAIIPWLALVYNVFSYYNFRIPGAGQ